MNKKSIVAGFLLFLSLPLTASYNMHYYENIIAQEFNRQRGGVTWYTSFYHITNQSTQGKTAPQRTQIIADLHALKDALYIARQQATDDGTRVWYWAYLFKDNQIIIDMLSEYIRIVNVKLEEFEWSLEQDIVKIGWTVSKYSAVFLAGMITVWATQNYLSQENYLKYHKHGLFEIIMAPAFAGWDLLASKKK